MTKGYVMIATGDEYVKQAYLCAKSIKETQTINNVTLLSSDNIPSKFKDVFDDVISIPHVDVNPNNLYRTDIRWKAFHVTPYEETVVLDTDMIFLTDVSHWWNKLKNHDVCFTKNVRTYKNNIVNNDYYRKTFTKNNIPMVYCAFHYFKQNDVALKYYKKLQKVCRNYKDYYKIYAPKNTPQVSSMDLNHGITVLEENIQNYIFQSASFVHMKSNVQDSELRQEDWTQSIPFYMDSNKKLKIGNYLQHGIFHYTQHEFCKQIGAYYD